jgi:hypothetical protein
MNEYVRFRTKLVANGLLAMALTMFICGCGEPTSPPVKLGVPNWKPSAVGGRVEVRPLPPANAILEDYRKWVEETPERVARVYETTLEGASNQLNFKVQIERGETPMGRPQHTYVSFLYSSETNGTYEFVWERLGRHNADFLKVRNGKKQVWVTFNWRASKSPIPILEIEAFEGMEVNGVLIARPGGTLK